jgi:anti-anti-sigma regulatory factor
MSPLRVEFIENGVRLSGEIDPASAGVFEDALNSAIDTIDGVLECDLRGITAFDGSGISALITAMASMTTRQRLAVRTSPDVYELFERAGLSRDVPGLWVEPPDRERLASSRPR